MNKKLEKVNEIHNTAIYKADGTTVIESSLFNLLTTYAKEALQCLEAIDNANSSDVFEYVENIQGEIEWAFEFNNGKMEEYSPRIMSIIKQYILKAQEQEKVLKIIKEKNVDVRFLRTCNVLGDYNYCQYLSDELTQEEFDSIKHYFIKFKLF